MWVTITLSNSNKNVIVDYLEMLYQKYGEKIMLTLNSSFSFDDTFILLYDVLDKIRLKNIPIQMGPQFLEDKFIIGNIMETKEELYFTTLGERIIWFLENYSEHFSVDKIVLISGDSDFVPASKIARREGIDFILNPMGNHIGTSLEEHIDGLINEKLICNIIKKFHDN